MCETLSKALEKSNRITSDWLFVVNRLGKILYRIESHRIVTFGSHVVRPLAFSGLQHATWFYTCFHFQKSENVPKNAVSLSVTVSIGGVMFLVPEVEDFHGCVCVFEVDFWYDVLCFSTYWDDDNQIVVLSLFDPVAIEEENKCRDDWDTCIARSVNNVLFEIFAITCIARFNKQ